MMHDEVIAVWVCGVLTGANLVLSSHSGRPALCRGIVPRPRRRRELYNINADHMAAACAEFIHADRLIYLTDVAGVLNGEKVSRWFRPPMPRI